MSRLATQRVLRWRLYLEEYNPSFYYKAGRTNVLADALSRVPQGEPSLVEETTAGQQNAAAVQGDDGFVSLLEDQELAECFLMHPVFDAEDRHPLKYKTIRDYQAQDEALNQRVVDTPQKYLEKFLLTGDV